MDPSDHLARRLGVPASARLGAAFLLVLAAGSWGLAREHRPWWLDCAVGLAVCTAALVRGRNRMWAAAAGLAISAAAALAAQLADLPGQPGAAATLALIVLVASSIRSLPARPAAAIAAGGAVLTAMLAGFHPDLGIGLVGLWWGAAVGAGLLLRLLDVRRQATVEAVRRAERLELARELHDVAAHHMTGVVLQAQAARIAARGQPAALDEALADIERAGTGALASMRAVIGLLRDGADSSGLAPGPGQLTDLVSRFARHGTPVRLRLPDGGADPSWPPEITSTVNRVVQEALTNVTRHAPAATEVTVTLARGRRALTVEITDDSPGGARRFPGSGGYGLTGMRERIEALGGTLSAGPAPDRGWSVRAMLPLAGRP